MAMGDYQVRAVMQKTAAGIMSNLEAKSDAKTGTLPSKEVPALYGALVDIAAPNRKVVHTPTVAKKLDEAVDAFLAPPAPTLLNKLGITKPAAPTRQQAMLADELLALAALGGSRIAQAARVGATGLRSAAREAR